MNINPEFAKHFDELEKGHIELWKKMNAYPEKGKELEERLGEHLAPIEPWRVAVMDKLGELTSDLSPEEKSEYINYIASTQYHKIGQEAPFYWRIINKPEGYAGDAEMMNIIYRNQFEGDTPFGMFLHKQAVDSKACEAVRNRRTFLREQIENVGGGRILSIAAGPAMEMRDILVKVQNENTYTFHAFDHDIKTVRKVTKECQDPRLKYLVGNALRVMKGNYDIAIPRKGMIDYCDPRKDTKGIGLLLFPFKYSRDTLKREDYDLVYTAGLYDYIKTFPDDPNKGTIALSRNLFGLVKPGGSLVIGNFSQNNPRDLRFPMEFIYNWQLYHRNEQEMNIFAQGIPQNQINGMQLIAEPTKINYFLKIDKK